MADSDGELMGCFSDDGATHQADVKVDQEKEDDEVPINGKAGKNNGKRQGRPKGTTSKVIKDNLKQKGGASARKDGEKQCGDCGKTKPVDEFKPDQALCTEPCLKRKRNIQRAAKTQGMMEWYHEHWNDKKKWKKVCTWYSKTCPVQASRKRAATFPIMQFKTYVRNEQQRLKDEEFVLVEGCLLR